MCRILYESYYRINVLLVNSFYSKNSEVSQTIHNVKLPFFYFIFSSSNKPPKYYETATKTKRNISHI